MRHDKFWLLLAAVLALTVAAAVHGAGKPPERMVSGTTITSTHDPAVKIILPNSAQYTGAARWDLYNCCDAELHVFVDADQSKRVQRVYWAQFESYLPDNDYIYQYPFTETTTHDGRLFDLDFRFARNDTPPKPGSDFEKVLELVAKAGFQMPTETLHVRLVQLLDAAKRKELMFVYVEDLAASGTSVDALNKPEGKAKWEALKPALLERAKERIRLADLAESGQRK